MILKLAFKNARSQIARLVLTTLSVVLSVAFTIAILTMSSTFQSALLHEIVSNDIGVDAAITPRATGNIYQSLYTIPESLYNKLNSLPAVEKAVGSLIAPGAVVGKDGRPLGAGAILYSVSKNDPFQDFTLVKGIFPKNAGQAIIDSTSAKLYRVQIGQILEFAGSTGSLYPVEITGFASFPFAFSTAGGPILGLEYPAISVATGVSGFNEIKLKAKAGYSQTQLVNEIVALTYGYPVKVETGQALLNSDENQIISGTTGFTNILLTFAIVGFFVSAIVIANSLRILAHQRARELALLRLIGAKRYQVFKIVIYEALIVGITGSLIGVALGLAIGAIFSSEILTLLGIHQRFPNIPVVGIALGLLLGVITTLIASLVPAKLATSLRPADALRTIKAEAQTIQGGLVRILTGFLITFSGILIIVISKLLHESIAYFAIGGSISFIGILVLAKLYVTPMIGAVGILLSPVNKILRLSIQGLKNNLKRTIATTTAIIVGFSIIVFFNTLGSSVELSLNSKVAAEFPYDFDIRSAAFGLNLPSNVIETIQNLQMFSQIEQVNKLAGYFSSSNEINQPIQFLSIDRSILNNLHFSFIKGAASNVDQPNSILISKRFADTYHLFYGNNISLSISPNVARSYKVVGIYSNQGDFSLSSSVLISHQNANLISASLPIYVIFLKLKPGVSLTKGFQKLNNALKTYPLVSIDTLSSIQDSISSAVNTLLKVLYALLAVAIIISFFGVMNSLTLSVVDRPYEFALMRALGFTRRSLYWLVTWEGIIISFSGALSGAIIGIVAARLVVSQLASSHLNLFSIPIKNIIFELLVASVAGLLAALIPSAKASRTQPAIALKYE